MPAKLPPFLTRDGDTLKITGTPYSWADFLAALDKPEGELPDLFPALTLGTLGRLREWAKGNPPTGE